MKVHDSYDYEPLQLKCKLTARSDIAGIYPTGKSAFITVHYDQGPLRPLASQQSQAMALISTEPADGCMSQRHDYCNQC